MLAEAEHLRSSAADQPTLTAPVAYAAAGATFLVIHAVLLAVRMRHARALA
jgi:hypothetical protein